MVNVTLLQHQEDIKVKDCGMDQASEFAKIMEAIRADGRGGTPKLSERVASHSHVQQSRATDKIASNRFVNYIRIRMG